MHLSSRFLLGVMGVGLTLGIAAIPAPAEDTTATPAEKKTIDVVICLDVSNSMDGLIASAKTKLWDIVNDLARAKPTPDLRVGLYSYGNDGYDPKVGWVRKELDLTTDLDAVSQKLFGLTTNGGTEYVARVCRDAIEQQKWSEAKDALRLIFVCGNEPASQDKAVRLSTVARRAKAKGIAINPIFCGQADHPDARDWKEFAAMGDGRFINIDQQSGAVAVSTPQDKELVALSEKLNTTYLSYGKQRQEKADNQAAQDANAVKLGAGAAAGRAVTKGGGLYRNSDWDLVDKLLDWFETFEIPDRLGPGERSIRIRDRYLPKGVLFDQRSAPEGFLFLLFYITLFISPDTPPFFSIDNIETSLNPKLCVALVRQIATLAKQYNKQVLWCAPQNLVQVV